MEEVVGMVEEVVVTVWLVVEEEVVEVKADPGPLDGIKNPLWTHWLSGAIRGRPPGVMLSDCVSSTQGH